MPGMGNLGKRAFSFFIPRKGETKSLSPKALLLAGCKKLKETGASLSVDLLLSIAKTILFLVCS